MFKFQRVEFDEIGSRTGLTNRQWGNLSIALEDTDTGHIRVVGLNVMLPKGGDVTMSELEGAAQSEAIAILSAALETLQGSSLAELAAREQD